MRVVITGGGGFLGARLAAALLARGTLTGTAGAQGKIEQIVLLDRAFPPGEPQDDRVTTIAGDVADPRDVERAITPDTASIFHLAAVVSGEAEANFDLGMRVNLDG